MNASQNHTYKLPSDAEIIALYESVQTIAVIGLSLKPHRPSHYVSKYMQEFGFDIIPVRPAVTEVLGAKAYKSLLDIPFQIDLANVFRASQHVAAITDQCIDKKVKAIWLPEGVIDIESAAKANNANIFTIMDRCIYKEYVRLMQ